MVIRFYNERAKEVRILTFVIAQLNVAWQIINFSKIADSQTYLAIQSIYWVSTLTSIFLMMLSFREGKLMTIKYAFTLLIYRNCLRLFDFEDTAMDDGGFFGTQILCSVMLVGYHLNFQRNPTNIRMGWFHLMFASIGLAKHQGLLHFDSLEAASKSILVLISYYIGVSIFLSIFSRSVKSFLM